MRWWMLLALVACKGKVTPGNAESADLEGFWVRDGTGEIWAFASASDAPFLFPTDSVQPADPQLGIFTPADPLPPEWAETSRYTVDGGVVEIAHLLGTPGGWDSLEITAIEPGVSMELEMSTGGFLAFSAIAECATEGPSGSTAFPTGCAKARRGGALAVDDQGAVHFTMGPETTGVSCPTNYGVHGPSCQPVRFELPALRGSALQVHGGRVHAALNIADADGERLEYWHRPTGSLSWVQTDLGSPVYGQVFLGFRPDGTPSILSHDGSTAVVIDVASTGANRTSVTDTTGGAVGEPLSAAMSPDGRWALLPGAGLYVESGGNFERIPRPTDFEVGAGGVVWDGADVHVAYTHTSLGSNPDGVGGTVVGELGAYGIWDGSSWQIHDLGRLMYPLLAGPGVVVHAYGKTDKPQMFISWVDTQTGEIRSEAVPVSSPSTGTVSADPTLQPAVAMGPDGTLAGFFQGDEIWKRRPDAPSLAGSHQLTITLSGTGRVASRDGLVDCSETCEVTVPWGTVLRYDVEVDRGSGLESVRCQPITAIEDDACVFPVVADSAFSVAFDSF